MAAPKGYSSLFSAVKALSLICLVLVCSSLRATAQGPIRTDMPVPPLQWLNLTALTKGSPPQPLMDSSMGYDESTRSLIIFGGESQAGVPQQTTYLLDLDSLTWSIPLSKVPKLSLSPPARSRALGTGDFAANSRRDFLVYGGKGSQNEAFGDVWAYDFLNQFWFNVTLSGRPPPARWGAVGGIDPANIPTSANNVSTIFNIAGGSDQKTSFPTSDLWQLTVSGTLASDLTTIQGQWQDIPLPSSLPGKAEAGGAIISQSQATQTRIVISGGCGSSMNPLNANVTCVDSTTYVLTVSPGASFSPAQCPAPRFGPVLVPNPSTASSSFASQSFLLLGTFDPSKWSDSGGLSRGEVAVLDVGAGTWARVLPAGDPASGTPTFPVPRAGAAALSFPSALVGDNRASASDTIVFGGRDASGTYSNDIWILRAYNGTITHTGEQWSGFGSGNDQLQTGVGASGAGVSVQYLPNCAQQLNSTSTSASVAPASTEVAPPSQTRIPPNFTAPAFDVSIVHKLLSPISVALALAGTVVVRLSSPTWGQASASRERRIAFVYVAIPASLVAYVVGIAGFVASLTSTTRLVPLQRRDGVSRDTFLKTIHGQAGFALFLGLYAVIPILASGLWLVRRLSKSLSETLVDEDAHAKISQDTGPPAGEKDTSARRTASPAQSAPEVHSTESYVRDHRQRTQSGPGLFPGWSQDRESSENSEPGPSKGFEVVNRPRRASHGTGFYAPKDISLRPGAGVVRSLSDISWLERRRSVGAVGELDYALSQLGHTSPRSTSPPATSRPPTVTMSNRPFVRTPTLSPTTSSIELAGWDIVLHILFHVFLLANSILVLVALFFRAPRAVFVVFLIWTLVFYICIFLLAWNGRPRTSLLVTALARLRTPALVADPTSPITESHLDERDSPLFHANISGRSPYVYHQPLWRRAVSPEEDLATRTSHGGLHPLDQEDPDDDEDDDDRQRRMEEELERRDVNIVTVPRRRLWIANPS